MDRSGLVAQRGGSRRRGGELRLNRGFVDEHDRYVVLNGIDAMALLALEALRLFAIFERLLAGGADQNLQQVFGDHVGDCTIEAQVSRL